MNLLEEKNRIIKFLREKLDEEGKNGYVIGVSGGLDSAVVLYLLLEAVGKDKIFALIMPEMDSEPSSLRDALFLVRNLDVPYKVFSLTNTLWVLGVYKIIPLFWLLLRPLKKKAVRYLYEEYSKSLGKPIFFAQRGKVNSKRFRWFYEGIAYYRIKHRLRMILLYFYAEKKNFLVVGCTNLTEELLGYYVKYGDDAADVAPLSHLYKTEVRELAKLLKVPEKIINKPPSPDLLPGITDEFSLGVDYETIDKVLVSFEEGISPEYVEGVDRSFVELIYDQYIFMKKEKSKPLKLARKE